MSTNKTSRSNKLPRRDFGKASPLDKLAEPVKAELRARLDDSKWSYKSIAAWLASAHDVRTSESALFYFRRRALGLVEAADSAAPRGGVEIIVPPQAHEVRFTVRFIG